MREREKRRKKRKERKKKRKKKNYGEEDKIKMRKGEQKVKIKRLIKVGLGFFCGLTIFFSAESHKIVTTLTALTLAAKYICLLRLHPQLAHHTRK